VPLDEGEGPDGYGSVGAAGGGGGGGRGTGSVRRKTLATLRLFVDRRLLLLAPTVVVAGFAGSLTVAAFHLVGCRIVLQSM